MNSVQAATGMLSHRLSDIESKLDILMGASGSNAVQASSGEHLFQRHFIPCSC